MSMRSIVLAALVAAGASAGFAAEPSGEAVAVIQATAVEGSSGNRPLKIKGPVFNGDVVNTDASGQAQLLFRDDTRLVVGPNSRLTIDRFVYAGQSTAREFAINTARGAFRFISGASRREAYTIRTPSATIGVRGTRFDVTVEGETTNLALYEGTVRLCDRGRPQRCTVLSGRCSVLILGPGEDFRWVRNVYERTELMDRLFPYAFRQAGLRADFRVQSRGCAARESPLKGIKHSGEPDRERDRGDDRGEQGGQREDDG